MSFEKTTEALKCHGKFKVVKLLTEGVRTVAHQSLSHLNEALISLTAFSYSAAVSVPSIRYSVLQLKSLHILLKTPIGILSGSFLYPFRVFLLISSLFARSSGVMWYFSWQCVILSPIVRSSLMCSPSFAYHPRRPYIPG